MSNTNKTLVYKSLEFTISSSSRYLKLFTCSSEFDVDCLIKTDNEYTNLKLNITNKGFCKLENFSTNLGTWNNFTKIIKNSNSYYIDFGSGTPTTEVTLKFNINYGNITIDGSPTATNPGGTSILELQSKDYTNTYTNKSRFKNDIYVETTTYSQNLNINNKTTIVNTGVVTVNTGKQNKSGYDATNGSDYDVKVYGTTVSKGLVVEKGLFSEKLTSSKSTSLTATELINTTLFKIGAGYHIEGLNGSSSIFKIEHNKITFGNPVYINNTLTVSGLSSLNGGINVSTQITGETSASSKFKVDTSGNTDIKGTLDVAKKTTLHDTEVTTLTASGKASLNGGIAVDTDKFTVADGTGDTKIAGTLNVTGKTTLNATNVTTLTASGPVTLNSTLTVVGHTSLTTLTASGKASLNGGITVDTDKFTVADGTGDTKIAGTLNVTGDTTLNETGITTLTVSGLSNLDGGIAVDKDKFTVADGTGDTKIAGTLNVTGDTILGNTSFSAQKVLTIQKGQITITDKGAKAGEYTATNMVDFILNVIRGELTFSGEFNAGETGEVSPANSYDYTTYED